LSKNAVIIGIFDGVHLGHQALLFAARQTQLSVMALTFDPHPATIFSPARTPKLLCTLADREALLRQHGAAAVTITTFDRAFAAQTPEEFVRNILINKLSAGAVIVGEDFRFGCDRSGDIASLRHFGETLGFDVEIVAPVFVDGIPARSTTIRQMVSGSELEEAARLLGRKFDLVGTVVHGRKLGRTIGFPTANLATDPSVILPGAGVYGGVAELSDHRRVRAAISVGTNPTVTPLGPVTVEAYLLDDFNEDLYDQRLRLEFHFFVRPMVQFGGLEPLIAQMTQDIDLVRARIPR
jgi:riboflavin kinase / FMN adenylyltransferase